MELSDVAWLAGPEGRAVLGSLPGYRPDQVLSESARLRAAGVSPEHAAAALTQSRLRASVQRRWGQQWQGLTESLLLTPDGAEQATRPVVARTRAERFAALGQGARVADLGCGLGVDSLALASRGLQVDAYELDPVTAAVAAANLGHARLPGDDGAGGGVRNVLTRDVQSLTAEEWDTYDAVYADPARRHGGRRLGDPEQWSPPLSWVLTRPVENLAVKVAPGIDRSLAPSDCELALVSVGGDVVEAALYRGALRSPGVRRSATVVSGHTDDSITVTDLDLPDNPLDVRPVGAFVHEPDGAVIRSGLVAAVGAQLGTWQIDPRIAYLSSDAPVRGPLSGVVASFEVHAVLPFSLKSLRAHLRAEGVGHVVVKKRGSAVDVDQLRHSLRLSSSADQERVVLLTRVGRSPLAIVASATRPDRAAGGGSVDRVDGGDEVPVVDEG